MMANVVKNKTYVGYDLDNARFIDEQGNEIPKSEIVKAVQGQYLDATMMAFRLITEFDFDHEALVAFYDEAE